MSDNIIAEREIFLNLIAAAEGARAWMATNAPATDWANKVRVNLHNALQPAISSKTEGVVLCATRLPGESEAAFKNRVAIVTRILSDEVAKAGAR